MNKKIDWDLLKFPLYTLGVVWIVFILNFLVFFIEFNTFGLIPRSLLGLIGIVTSPLLHSNLQHIIANSLPLLVLLYFLIFLFPKRYIEILVVLILTSGGLLWLVGRSAIHIGASTLIYALATFVISYAWFKKDKKAVIAAVFIVFIYSGLIWGVLPIINGPMVSWDGHLMGAIAGGLTGKLYEKRKLNV